MNIDQQLQRVRAALSDAEWIRRVTEAERQATIAERIFERHRSGESKRAAIRAEAPDDPETTWVARLKRYQTGDGLCGGAGKRLARHRFNPAVS